VPDFSVCVLLYGDYPKLAERVLKSLARPEWRGEFDMWIGMNNVSNATKQVIHDYAPPYAACVPGDEPYHKYPLMRRMFYNWHGSPLKSPYVMWFDDDSYVLADAPSDWFNAVRAAMTNADMIGDIWWRRAEGNQHLFIRNQPWYRNKTVMPAQKVYFVTGGWWTIRSEILERHNWPIPELDHCGGDMLLGELCSQQGYKLCPFKTGVAINANEAGKNSGALRRGFRQRLCGFDYTETRSDE
jgi:hypothetical protein